MNSVGKLLELEEQFILRLPINEANVIRNMLQKKPKRLKKNMSIEINENMRTAEVKINKKVLNGIVQDLPTVVESNKTVDGVHLYKVADICKILCCVNEKNENIDMCNINANNKIYRMTHGLCPPMKNCRQRRMRKTLRNREEPEQAKEIEKELLYLLRMDLEAVSTRYEFIDDPNAKLQCKPSKKVTEKYIFGDISDCSSDSSSKNDIMDYTN